MGFFACCVCVSSDVCAFFFFATVVVVANVCATCRLFFCFVCLVPSSQFRTWWSVNHYHPHLRTLRWKRENGNMEREREAGGLRVQQCARGWYESKQCVLLLYFHLGVFFLFRFLLLLLLAGPMPILESSDICYYRTILARTCKTISLLPPSSPCCCGAHPLFRLVCRR